MCPRAFFKFFSEADGRYHVYKGFISDNVHFALYSRGVVASLEDRAWYSPPHVDPFSFPFRVTTGSSQGLVLAVNSVIFPEEAQGTICGDIEYRLAVCKASSVFPPQYYHF